jgi:hypothetical protein
MAEVAGLRLASNIVQSIEFGITLFQDGMSHFHALFVVAGSIN